MTTMLDILIAKEPGKSISVTHVDDEPLLDLFQRISHKLNEDTTEIHERDLFINGIRLTDHQKTLSHHRISGNCLTYLSLKYSDIMTVYVTMLTGKNIHIRCDPLHSIRHLKELVEMKEGITPEVQRFVFQGQLLNDESRTLGAYNITHESRVHLVLALRGSFAPGVAFADVSDTSAVHKYEFSDSAPKGRVCEPGANIECQCECTPDYQVISPQQFGVIDLSESLRFRCPNCKKEDKAVPVTVGFMECRYRFHGITDTGDQYSSDWKDVTKDDCYQLFDARKQTTWRQLIIEAVVLSTRDVCFICLGSMTVAEKLDCGHRFHSACFERCKSCPRCHFNQHLIRLLM